MKTVSLFSGIGGLDLGLEDAGHEIILQVESDPHCIQARPARPSWLSPPSEHFALASDAFSALRARLPARANRCSSTTSPAGRCVATSPSSPSFPPRRSSSPRGSRVRCVPTDASSLNSRDAEKNARDLGNGEEKEAQYVHTLRPLSILTLSIISIRPPIRMSPRSTSRVPVCATARKLASARTCSAFCARRVPQCLGCCWRSVPAF